jgi:hypothetical protein
MHWCVTILTVENHFTEWISFIVTRSASEYHLVVTSDIN